MKKADETRKNNLKINTIDALFISRTEKIITEIFKKEIKEKFNINIPKETLEIEFLYYPRKSIIYVETLQLVPDEIKIPEEIRKRYNIKEEKIFSKDMIEKQIELGKIQLKTYPEALTFCGFEYHPQPKIDKKNPKNIIHSDNKTEETVFTKSELNNGIKSIEQEISEKVEKLVEWQNFLRECQREIDSLDKNIKENNSKKEELTKILSEKERNQDVDIKIYWYNKPVVELLKNKVIIFKCNGEITRSWQARANEFFSSHNLSFRLEQSKLENKWFIKKNEDKIEFNKDIMEFSI